MDPVPFDNLIAATVGRFDAAAPPRESFSGVSIDSRTTGRGEVFWALAGETHDGHNFLEQARQRGALAAVVERPIDSPLPQLLVADSIRALGDFAGWYRERQSALIVGVTGSVGKTTTRRMIHSVLGSAYRGLESPKNFNNRYGVPLSLLSLGSEHEYGVIEMGASAPGEILELGRVARHEIAVITAISEAHLEGFGTLDRVAAAKSEILETLSGGGFAVLNGDCPRVRGVASRTDRPVLFCGFGENNHYRIEHVRALESGLEFRVNGERFTLPAVGRHLLMSAAIAVAIGSEIGLSVADIDAGLRTFTPVEGRCVPRRIGDWTVIDDTYNASPLSMEAACRLLAEWPGAGRRVLVAGDMLELGVDAPRHHRELGRLVAESSIDFLIAHGEFAQDVAEAARRCGAAPHQLADCPTEEVIQLTLDCWLQPGDVVLVKGSRGMRMERIVAGLERLANAREDAHQTQTARPLRACA